MAKVKDLGIKVIPETMRPLEAGGGAGCGVSVQQAICLPLGTHCGCSLRICTVLNTHPWCWWPSNQTCWCSFISPIQQQVQCPGLTVACAAGTGPCAGTDITTPFQQTIAQQPTELTRESIATLKEQLQQQIAKLDEHAKTLDRKK